MTVFSRLLADRRAGALWWVFGTVIGVATIVGLWPTVRGNADIEELVADLPASIRVLLGSQEGIPLSSAAGYLQARLFSTMLPVLLVIYGISLGSRVIGAPEEDGSLQLVVAGPITRRRIAVERLAASTVLLVGLAGAGLVAALGLGALVDLYAELSPARMVLAMIAVVELATVHFAIAATVGAVTGRRGPAVSIASAVAGAGYLVHGLSASAGALRPLRAVSPWWWLLDRNLLVQSPTALALGLPLILSLGVLLFGLIRYERRDLRFP